MWIGICFFLAYNKNIDTVGLNCYEKDFIIGNGDWLNRVTFIFTKYIVDCNIILLKIEII